MCQDLRAHRTILLGSAIESIVTAGETAEVRQAISFARGA